MRLAPTLLCLSLAGWLLAPGSARGQAAAGDASVQQLIQQNQTLQGELQAQQQTIDALKARLSQIDRANAHQQDEIQDLSQRLGAPAAPDTSSNAAQEIRLSGEAGFGWFDTGSKGQWPNSEFRVDEARIFVEAPVWNNVYAFVEVDPRTREADDDDTYLGQFYFDFENISGAWGGADDLVNLRAGRFYVPFGEEYLTRFAVDDPLVSHSITDIWGLSQGVELYGRRGRVQYAAAVQEGGGDTLQSFNNDKSVAARVGYDPQSWLHLSASAMRTGRVESSGDEVSALWFANGFFRAIGPPAETTEFDASLYEIDGGVSWTGGDLKAAAGLVRFDDNNPAGGDGRVLNYGYIEGQQQLAGPLYAAARWSRVSAPGGYPLNGQGTLGADFFSGQPATELERLSFDLGYRFGPPLVLKVEYSPEWGRTLNGQDRDNEDMLATELGVKF